MTITVLRRKAIGNCGLIQDRGILFFRIERTKQIHGERCTCRHCRLILTIRVYRINLGFPAIIIKPGRRCSHIFVQCLAIRGSKLCTHIILIPHGLIVTTHIGLELVIDFELIGCCVRLIRTAILGRQPTECALRFADTKTAVTADKTCNKRMQRPCGVNNNTFHTNGHHRIHINTICQTRQISSCIPFKTGTNTGVKHIHNRMLRSADRCPSSIREIRTPTCGIGITCIPTEIKLTEEDIHIIVILIIKCLTGFSSSLCLTCIIIGFANIAACICAIDLLCHRQTDPHILNSQRR